MNGLTVKQNELPLAKLKSLGPKFLPTIAFSEGTDDRILSAALEAIKHNIAKIILIGSRSCIEKKLICRSGIRNDFISIHDPEKSAHTEQFGEIYYKLRIVSSYFLNPVITINLSKIIC